MFRSFLIYSLFVRVLSCKHCSFVSDFQRSGISQICSSGRLSAICLERRGAIYDTVRFGMLGLALTLISLNSVTIFHVTGGVLGVPIFAMLGIWHRYISA
jgi:hypothetical protein